MKYELKKGDIVTLNAEVIGVTGSGNPIVRFNSGVKVLAKYTDINTIRPAVKVDGEDKRKGN